MVTVTLEYNNNNAVLNGILNAVAKMPDVKIIKTWKIELCLTQTFG